jgi:phosphatidylinositol alpha-1,6-mannosyltransferase
VLPSRGEGFGIAFLEAAAFSKPSVAVAEGGAPEVIEDGVSGRLVDPADQGALAQTLTDLLGRPAELARLGEGARRRLEERFLYATFRDRLGELLALPPGAAARAA